MTMITPSYLGETIEYSSLHACRSTLEDPISNCATQSGWHSWFHSPVARTLAITVMTSQLSNSHDTISNCC